MSYTSLRLCWVSVLLTVLLCCILHVLSATHRHKFVNNELIVKTGLVDKRKVGLLLYTTVADGGEKHYVNFLV